MTRVSQIALAATAICLATSVRAHADPVTLTVGFLYSTGKFQISPPSSVTGTDGFRLNTVIASDTQLNLFGFCNGDATCAPGQEISIGGLLGTAFGDAGLIDTVVSLRGIEYQDFSFAGSDLQFKLIGSVIAPAFNGLEDVAVMAPFSLTGVFTDPQGRSTTLIGRGTATAWLTRSDGGEIGPAWFGDRIRYDFAEPSVVPEPSTMILFGSGIAALIASRRRLSGMTSRER